jgi:hypothetical protein
MRIKHDGLAARGANIQPNQMHNRSCTLRISSRRLSGMRSRSS